MDLIGITKGSSTYDIKDTTARQNIDVIVDVLNGLSQDVSLISGGIIKLNADPSTLTPTQEQIGQIGTYNGEQYRAVSNVTTKTLTRWIDCDDFIIEQEDGLGLVYDYEGKPCYDPTTGTFLGNLVITEDYSAIYPEGHEELQHNTDVMYKDVEYDTAPTVQLTTTSWELINWSDPKTVKTITGTGCTVTSGATDYLVIHTNATTTLAYYILGNKVQHICGRLVETPGFGLYDHVVSNGITTFSINTPADTKTTVVALGENAGELTLGTPTAQSPWGVTYSDAIDQQARVDLLNKQDQFTWETNEADLVLDIQHTDGSKSKLLIQTDDAILIIEDNQGGDLVTPNVVVTPINEAAVALYDGSNLEIGGITTSGYILMLNGITTAKLIPLDSDTYDIGEETAVSPDTTHVSRTTHVSEVLITCTADQYAALKATGGPGINPRAMYLVTDENPASGQATLTPVQTYTVGTDDIVFDASTMYDD